MEECKHGMAISKPGCPQCELEKRDGVTEEPISIEYIEETIQMMQQRLKTGQGTRQDAMCRLSLRMSETLMEEFHTYRDACNCAELVAQVDTMRQENARLGMRIQMLGESTELLRESCEKLCCVTWSGHNCVSCGLPTAETEHVVGFGVCTRCMDKDLNDDQWKDLKKKIDEEGFRVNDGSPVVKVRKIHELIDGIRGG